LNRYIHHQYSPTFIVGFLLLFSLLFSGGCNESSFFSSSKNERLYVYPEVSDYELTVSGRGQIECEIENIATVPPKFVATLEFIVEDGAQVSTGDELFRLSTERLKGSAIRFEMRAKRQQITYDKAVVKNMQAQEDKEEEYNATSSKYVNAKAKETFLLKGFDPLEVERSSLELNVAKNSINYFSKRFSTQKALKKLGYASQLEILKIEDNYEQAVLRKENALTSLNKLKAGKTAKEKDKLSKTSKKFLVTSKELAHSNKRQIDIDTLSQEREKLRTESLKAAAKQRFDILKNASVTAQTTGTAVHLDTRNYGIPKLQEGVRVWRGMNLIKVIDTSILKAKIKVATGDIEQVKKGQLVNLTFPSLPEVYCAGKIAKVGKVAVSDKFMGKDGTKQFDVSITIENKHQKLIPNLSVKADIVVLSLKNSTRLPSSCIYTKDKTKVIDVMINSHSESKKVTILGKDHSFTYIKEIINGKTKVLLPLDGGL